MDVGLFTERGRARRASRARVNGKVFSGVAVESGARGWQRPVWIARGRQWVGRPAGRFTARHTHAAPPCDERGRAVRAVRGPGHVASQAHGARAPHPSTAPLRAPAPAGSLLLFALRLPLPRHCEQVSLLRPSSTSPTSTWCGVRRPPNNITSTSCHFTPLLYTDYFKLFSIKTVCL